MAYVTFTNGKHKNLTHEQGVALWEVLQGQREPTPQQEKWAMLTKSIYLEKYSAPEDYIERYLSVICKQVLADYSVNRQGFVTNPDKSRPLACIFVQQHQLPMMRAKKLHPRG